MGFKDQNTSTYCVFNATQESFLSLRVKPADTHFARLKGLVGKLRLEADEGMWVLPSSGVHTIGVPFSIDLIYLDEKNRVVHMIESFGGFRIGPLRMKCASVLELPTRTIYSSQTQLGDQLLICPPEELKTYLGEREARLGADSNIRVAAVEEKPNWTTRFLSWLTGSNLPSRAPRKTLPIWSAYWNGSTSVEMTVQNVSLTGAFLNTSEQWYVGTLVSVTFQSNSQGTGFNEAPPSVTVMCRVVRLAPFGMGVAFLFETSKHKKAVYRFIQSLPESKDALPLVAVAKLEQS